MDKLVTIATYDFPILAEAAKLALEDRGIPAFLVDDQLVNTNWFLSNAVGGAKLQVRASDAERASVIVDEMRQTASDSSVGSDKPDVTFDCEECGRELTFPGKRRGHVETCPHCHEYVDVPE